MGKSVICSYLEKQKQFIKQVKSIQYDIINKEYKKHGCSFNDYVKSKWNISKAQAYRYLISAKVLDQLKEYDILPNYERLCRTINSITETSQQIKLLWGTIVKRYRNSPDNINSSMITKVWKELCMDKKYSNICHIERNFNEKIENTLGNYSRKIKSKQLNSKTNQIVNNIKNNVSPNNKMEVHNSSEINYSNVINNNNHINNKNTNLPLINTTKSTIVYLTSAPTPISANSNIMTPSTPININNCNNTNFNNVVNNNINNTVINNNSQHFNYTYFNNQIPSPVPSTVISPIPVNDNSIPSPVPTTIISPVSANDNPIPSPVPTIVSPTITVPENSMSYQNNLSSQNNIQYTTYTTTTPPTNENNLSSQNNIQYTTYTTTTPPTNEICYVPTYQPQYILCNNQNQVQNIIIY